MMLLVRDSTAPQKGPRILEVSPFRVRGLFFSGGRLDKPVRSGQKGNVRVPGYAFAAFLLLLAAGGIAFRGLGSGGSGDAGQDSGASATIRRAGDRGEDGRRRSASRNDRFAVATIRAAMAAGLSDPGMLEEALAACRRLGSTAEIEELLSDPDYGWPPLSGGEFPDVEAFKRLHRGLFERWGELDADGAIARIRETGVMVDEDYNGLLLRVASSDDGHAISSAGWLFKGAAAVDGEDAFRRLLLEWAGLHQSEHWTPAAEVVMWMVAIEPLMEGWASSDGGGAWENLIDIAPRMPVFRSTVEGFFRGLSPDRIDDMRGRVEAYDERGEPAGLNPAAHVRREFAKNWLRSDPAGALAWYEPHAGDLLFNRSSIDAILDGTRQARVYAELVGEWMAADFDKASAWLPSWQPQTVSVDEVFQRIAGDGSLPERVRERAGELIR